MFLHYVRKLWRTKKEYTPLIEVRISKSAILSNFDVFSKRLPLGSVAPVLKSNSYGHGIVEVAHILKERAQHIPFLCVDSYFEARTLRKEGINQKILIISYTDETTMLRSQFKNISFAVHSLDQLHALTKEKRAITIHLKIDTGMHRHGIMPDEVLPALTTIQNNPHITLEGVFSHIADADGETEDSTHEQIRIWNGVVQKIKNVTKSVRYFHLAQTAGSDFNTRIDANLMRIGLGLYGLTTRKQDPIKPELIPALSMHTRISSIKTIAKGDRVGYNGTFTAEHNMTIATIPVGYSEGLDRSLSNTGFVYIGNHACPILGRISMNITSIDVTGVADITRNTPVEVISTKRHQKNSIEYMDILSATFAYELLVHIPRHLKRIVIS